MKNISRSKEKSASFSFSETASRRPRINANGFADPSATLSRPNDAPERFLLAIDRR